MHDALLRYPLVDALINRRSRRFGKGMQLNGGPLAYASAQAPEPLSLDEEAALAFAACGTTRYALAELTSSYIKCLLFAFGEEFGGYWIDERNWFMPAGLGKFACSRGGHLYDDLRKGRSAPLSYVETWLYEVVTIEQGGILQNLGLM